MADGARRSVNWESWTDRQIREAMARGEFDGLPGHGQPIADLAGPHDELRWVKDKLRRENLSWLPPSLQLRKEAEDALAAAAVAASESDVRTIVTAINERIRAQLRNPSPGPPLNLMPFDPDRIVASWRAGRPTEPPQEAQSPREPVDRRARRARWWRR